LLRSKSIVNYFRQDTAAECISLVMRNSNNNLDAVRKAMIGSIVVARYCNDKTYRIDEVDFDVNPMCKYFKN